MAEGNLIVQVDDAVVHRATVTAALLRRDGVVKRRQQERDTADLVLDGPRTDPSVRKAALGSGLRASKRARGK
jgi:hypothetical protein